MIRGVRECIENQANWGAEYKDTIFSGGMHFSDGGRVVENKMLYALLQQGGFVAAFTGECQQLANTCFSAAVVESY